MPKAVMRSLGEVRVERGFVNGEWAMFLGEEEKGEGLATNCVGEMICG